MCPVLVAWMQEHRAGLIELIGHQRPLQRCPGASNHKGPIVCDAWVYEAADSEGFCRLEKCPFKPKAVREEGPF